ncbi:MAG: SpoIIE family protein phosphatase, partial [Gemmatimonadota bacterium]|nr:SpoIIE family protein phosphatase [Gemmatimonadota bacterium]
APWTSNSDLLVLFTDGIPDSRNANGDRLGESMVLDTISRHRAEPVGTIVERVFDLLRDYSGEVPSPDDLTLLVLRS